MYWSGQLIYDPTNPDTREWVQTFYCSTGGGGGSVASGTLISMADGTKTPVQDVTVGSTVIVYDVESGYKTVAVIRQVQTVTTDSLLTIHTDHGFPFRADANPRMRLHVMVDGTLTLMPITQIQPGDQIYNYDLQSWVTVADVTIAFGGRHVMFDLLTDPLFSPTGGVLEYIANGYPDCQRICKN